MTPFPHMPVQQEAAPRTVTKMLFNGVAGFMSLPGLAGNQPGSDDPTADQGLGFHQDGTARQTDGTTGTNAARAHFDGRRAAEYAGHGLGYGPGDMHRAHGPGYDPVTGRNFRYGEGTYLGHSSRYSREYSLFNLTDPQSFFMQRGLNDSLGCLNSAGEGAVSALIDNGWARFNFMVGLDGHMNGEGDVLYPFYDGQYTTVFTLAGSRTMNCFDQGGDKDAARSDLMFQPVTGGGNFNDASGSTAIFSVEVLHNGSPVTDGTAVTCNVQHSCLTANQAVSTAQKATFGGLTLGASPVTGTGTTQTSTTSGGIASVTLKDILGERMVVVQAAATIEGAAQNATQQLTFRQGPLAAFRLSDPDNPTAYYTWENATFKCGGISHVSIAESKYFLDTNLPPETDGDGGKKSLQTISGSTYAAMRSAAGMPPGSIWTGTTVSTGMWGMKVKTVDINSGNAANTDMNASYAAICVR